MGEVVEVVGLDFAADSAAVVVVVVVEEEEGEALILTSDLDVKRNGRQRVGN
jgi:hypothetical protein